MSSRDIVDPELAPFLDHLLSFDFQNENIQAIREEQSAFPGLVAPPAPDVDVWQEEIFATGGHTIRILLYKDRGASAKAPAFLHIHGGGFMFGTPETHDAVSRYQASQIGGIVASIDYRLAPETPFPGALEDCYEALAWLNANADRLGVDCGRIAIGGESAGGGLAAALALLARDRGDFTIVFQHLTYPMLDDRTGSVKPAEIYAHAGEFVWTAQNNRFAWRAMLGHLPGGDDLSPYAAPARASDLSGLPPAFIAIGALDLFLEENLDYARRLIRQGVPVELHVYPGAFHAFNLIDGANVAKQYERDSLAALVRALSI